MYYMYICGEQKGKEGGEEREREEGGREREEDQIIDGMTFCMVYRCLRIPSFPGLF